MNTDREKKRAAALEQIREQERLSGHTGGYDFPAIHPRYRAVYGSIYRDEEQNHKTGTFWIRFLISLLLLAGFLNMKDTSLPEYLPQQSEIVRQIQKPVRIPSWKQFDLTHIL